MPNYVFETTGKAYVGPVVNVGGVFVHIERNTQKSDSLFGSAYNSGRFNEESFEMEEKRYWRKLNSSIINTQVRLSTKKKIRLLPIVLKCNFMSEKTQHL